MLKKLGLYGFVSIIIAIFSSNIIFYFYETNFIYQPSLYPLGNWQPTSLNVQDVMLPLPSGEVIHGWYINNKQAKHTLLYFHGNNGNVTNHYQELKQLYQLPACVLIIDYPGFGKSTGSPTQANMIASGLQAATWLAKKQSIKRSNIIIL